jgi:peptidoglycan/xylan/chitin deacetylase (PgdA/CDA1 family)
VRTVASEWTGVGWPPSVRREIEALSPHDSDRLAASLRTPPLSGRSQALRAAAHAVARPLPASWKKAGASLAKRARSRSWAAPESVLVPPLARFPQAERPWHGKRGALVVTHDVDTRECLDALDTALAEDRRRDLVPTVFFLADGPYALDAARLAALAAAGVGIGLHGWSHDPALGGRAAARIRRDLTRSLDRLGPGRPGAFRAPSFATSPRLVAELAALEILVDSSRALFHPAYRSTACALPFGIPETGGRVRELPVVIEDSLLFRDWRLSEQAALDWCRRAVDLVVASGGVVTVNVHPSTGLTQPRFLPALLDILAARGDLWPASLDTAARTYASLVSE